jgi:hypothetical protein
MYRILEESEHSQYWNEAFYQVLRAISNLNYLFENSFLESILLKCSNAEFINSKHIGNQFYETILILCEGLINRKVLVGPVTKLL